ncbi:TolC family protein [Bernardetia sp.]|uniref:TolC family protein n=1 Tax=Bernardetia sp. TaxID=1937974 RepID=UPI0025C284DA|nr:TolC family protein [Bernardetia sp.]
MKKIFFLWLLFTNITFLSQAQTLEDYFVVAAENNPKLKADYKAFEMALQKTTQVNALPDPNLSLGYFLSPIETRVGAQQFRAELSQMFPWFGTLSARRNVAALEAEAIYQKFLDAKNQLYYEVSVAYFDLYEIQKLREIERQNINILDSYKNVATIKFENAQGSMVDVLRVELMLKEATTSLNILEKKEMPLRSKFVQLLNIDADSLKKTGIALDSTVFQKIYSFTDIALQKDSLLVNNPVLEALEYKLQSSQAKEELAQKEGLPKLGVGVAYVATAKRTDMEVMDNGKDAVMPMISMSLPIYRKKYKAAQRKAQLEQEMIQFQKENKTNQLLTTYDKIWFQLQRQQELITLYQAQKTDTEHIIKLLYAAYTNIGTDFEEVLRMQKELLMYQKKIIIAQKNYQTAIAELNYLTHKR